MTVEAGYSAGEVARRLGVAVTTLRTWHQRYGLGPSRHAPGRHRRYTDQDLARLDIMARLTAQGLPAAEAARIALTNRADPAAAPAAARDGGGHAIPVGRADPAARGLARAAMRLDASTMTESITVAIRERGVVDTWDDILRPVLVGIGNRHAATGQLVEVEHLLSRTISEVLAAVPRPHPAPPPRVLLACAAEEQHSLPLEALAAALAEHGHASRLLGARVPTAALAAAIHRTRPTAVVVWSHTPTTGDPGQLEAATAQRHRPLLVAAGPGWPELPPHIERPATLADTLALLVPIAGG